MTTAQTRTRAQRPNPFEILCQSEGIALLVLAQLSECPAVPRAAIDALWGMCQLMGTITHDGGKRHA